MTLTNLFIQEQLLSSEELLDPFDVNHLTESLKSKQENSPDHEMALECSTDRALMFTQVTLLYFKDCGKRTICGILKIKVKKKITKDKSFSFFLLFFFTSPFFFYFFCKYTYFIFSFSVSPLLSCLLSLFPSFFFLLIFFSLVHLLILYFCHKRNT